MNLETMQHHIDRIGAGILRYSLVVIFLGFGLYKFTAQEAAAIAPLTENSPFFFWLNPLLGTQGGSNLIGVVEVAIAVAIAARKRLPLVSAVGSLAAAGSLVVTLSFLISTPGLDPMSADAAFIVKDSTLLGAALWTAAEALRASYADRARSVAIPRARLIA